MSAKIDTALSLHPIVVEEQELLARVASAASEPAQRTQHSKLASGMDKDLLELRDAIRDAKPEDLAPLVEQMTRVASLRSKLGQSKDLPLNPQNPYFAHMRLEQPEKTRDILIGKRGFIDRENNVQIVDWRNAPISQLYYRYDEGDDYDESFGGNPLTGIITARRNVAIKDSLLQRIGCPQGSFVHKGDGTWDHIAKENLPVLRGGQNTAVRTKVPHRQQQRKHRQSPTLGIASTPLRADKMLPEIAALIDKEQFDLITRPESGLVVIQGGAGSGKTTVALHRVAYLHFANKQRFSGKRVLFIVPSKALQRYIAGVLPSLGVPGIPVWTFESWAHSIRKRILPNSPNKYNDATSPAITRLKKHPACLQLIDDYYKDAAKTITGDLESSFSQSPTVLWQWRQSHDKPIVPRLRELWRWTRTAELPPDQRRQLEGLVRDYGQQHKDILESFSQLFTDQSRLQDAFAGDSSVSEEAIERLHRHCSRQCSGFETEQDDGVAGADIPKIKTDEPIGRFDPEDNILLLRMCQKAMGGLVATGQNQGRQRANGQRGGEQRIEYQHVAIDEAQDRSALDISVLLDATKSQHGRRSVTIAGDIAQRIVFDNGFSGWQQMLQQTGQPSIVEPLRLSYRSTKQVMDFAHHVLGPELAPTNMPVARDGVAVEILQYDDPGIAIAFLAEQLRTLMVHEPSASIALLTRYAEQADVYHTGLLRSEVPLVRRIRNQEFSFTPGIDVTEASRIKGLEFDYVILLDVNRSSYPDTIPSRHLLHIAATRAAHQLWVVTTSTPSPLLPI